ncbi:DMT family transporter [Psychrobium sp. 1_MG-2023]|uniref:DMT family transporter n=1 Tax=Psychrobium sp. 1_MG-2023 TaxID=3062624 RepID=UPI000C32ED08|nr:DMT family transporter [Psychrobium sp. 1_MG-2023]MDP2560954.1 DMT family transporter [Psychrobium sp. 1_MG-2023]PKF56026.1 multidrug DMT transporter permease [Alteromonadales bacterium alter-6D02]
MRTSQLLLGILFILCAELSFVLLSALIKVLSDDVSLIQIIFFRNLFALLPLLPWLIKHKQQAVTTSKLSLHLMRGITGVTAMFIYFYILSNSSLINGAMVLMLAPFFIPLIAFYWLRQPQSLYTILAISIGFFGVFICLNTTQAQTTPLSLMQMGLILFGALCVAISKASISKMTTTEPSQRIVFYFSTISLIVSAILLPFDWQPLNLMALGLLVILGVGATAAQILMTKAFTLAGATTIGLFSYSSILFAALVGAIFWNNIPEYEWFIGASIIIVSGIIATIFAPRRK